jgi:large repetitive protein
MSRVKPSNPVINRSHPLARGLVGAWAFQDGGGSVLRDVSGHGNDGTFVGTPTWISAERGGALDFSGSNCIDLGNKADFKPAVNQGISFSAWARPDTVSGNDFIYGHRYSGGSSAIQLARFGSGFYVLFFSNGRAETAYQTIAGVFAVGVWVHLVAVRRPDGQIDAYVDGVKTTLGTVCSGAISDQNVSAFIGRHSRYPASQDWDGQIQDFRMWSRALADTEVIDLYVGDDLYSPAIDTFERYYERVPLGAAGQPAFKRWSQRTNQPIFGRGF